MATMLLSVIYIAFIVWGNPNSLFGRTWPAIDLVFGLPVSAVSAVILLMSGYTVLRALAARL